MLEIGRNNNLRMNPIIPIIANPIAHEEAVLIKVFLFGFSHLSKKILLSTIKSLTNFFVSST